MSNRQAEITALLVPIVASLQLELLGVEFVPSGAHALLRLYIDVLPDAQRQVSIEDCAAVSREISATLDVNDPISSAYTLEVSSPGIDRPLFTPEQFNRHAGETAKITLELPINGRRRMHGRIDRVDSEEIVLIVDGKECPIPHGNIEKARLVPDYVALGIASPKRLPLKDAAATKVAPKPPGVGQGRRAGNKPNRNAAGVTQVDAKPATEHES